MENLKLTESERRALVDMMKRCFSEHDREHNAWAVEYLERAYVKDTLELEPEFTLYFSYFKIDAVRDYTKDRSYGYLKNTGFVELFNDWFGKGFKKCIDEINGI